MSRKRRRRKSATVNQKRPQLAYYIQRLSHVDDSQFFNDEGRRIKFASPSLASWFMNMFDPDQKAKIVKRPVEPGDVDFKDVAPEWLPDSVSADDYLAAMKTISDAPASRRRGPSRHAVRVFLKQQRQKFEQFEQEV